MRFTPLIALAAALAAPPASAEVSGLTDQGFVIKLEATVKADAQTSWRVLGQPGQWWSSAHTFSGDAANMALDMRAGGCFCEALPADKGKPRAAPRGNVEHLHVVFADRGRMLRMVGALGPLQSEAVRGSLTISLKPVDGGTSIVWEYVVGGYMRYKTAQIAPGVDGVLKEQLTNLAARIDAGGRAGNPAPATKNR